MSNGLNFQPLQEKLSQAKSQLILLPSQPKVDPVAAGLALYLSLRKQGKTASIACPTKMTVGFNRLIGVDKIKNQIGGKNLIISFDYVEDSIEKVSYNIEDDKFNLVVQPKAGQPPLDPNKVSYSQVGASGDLIIVISAQKPEELGEFWNKNKSSWQNKDLITINNEQTEFGQIKLVEPQFKSCSIMIAETIKSLNLPVDPDITTNLYAGLAASSDGFHPAKVSAPALETAAWCLKSGAQKIYLEPTPPAPSQAKSTPVQPVNSQPSQPIVNQSDQPTNNQKQPPPDWFKPKIYKSSASS